jgi:hypothetical protein
LPTTLIVFAITFGNLWNCQVCRASFNEALFTEDAFFIGMEFTNGGSFWGARFSGDARFERTVFAGTAIFGEVQFAANSWYSEAHFASVHAATDVDEAPPTAGIETVTGCA